MGSNFDSTEPFSDSSLLTTHHASDPSLVVPVRFIRFDRCFSDRSFLRSPPMAYFRWLTSDGLFSVGSFLVLRLMGRF
jgi:hypothetical protein